MTYKKQKRFLVISADCEGYIFGDFVRAVDKEAASKMVALARPDVVESNIRSHSVQEVKEIIHNLVSDRNVADNAFDLLREFGEIDDTEPDQAPNHIKAAHEGLPGKKLKTRDTMFADSHWANEKTGKHSVVTLPAGSRATVALRADPQYGPVPEGQFRIVFDLPVKDMYCDLFQVLTRFFPAGKKDWNL